jgi:hypothetical protein
MIVNQWRDESRLVAEVDRLTAEVVRLNHSVADHQQAIKILEHKNKSSSAEVLRLKNELVRLFCVETADKLAAADRAIVELADARRTINHLRSALSKIAIGPMSVGESSRFGVRAAAIAAGALDRSPRGPEKEVKS